MRFGRTMLGAMLLTVALTPRAHAHIMPPGNGSSRIVGARAHTLIAIPVSTLPGVDDDGDGRLSPAELGRHRAEIERHLEGRVRLLSHGKPGRTIYQTLLVEHSDDPAEQGMTSLTLMRVSEWDSTVTALTVEAPLLARSGHTIAFRVVLGDSTETGSLSAQSVRASFFDPTATTGSRRLTVVLSDAVLAALVFAGLGGIWLLRRRRLRTI